MSSWFDAQGIDGYSGIAPGEPAPGGYGSGSDVNPSGAESDPFAYTQGSLWTPWGGKFVAPAGSSGGYSAPAYTPFNYGDFGYNYSAPGGFDERYATPDKFSYADFAPPETFRAPTAEDMQADPGYAARLAQGQKSLEAGAAAKGILRTGGAAKGLMDYGQNAASQEYGNVYTRKSGEYDRTYGQAKDVYGINRGNAAENYDRNTAAGLNAYTTRQGAWRGNADVSIAGQTLGYNVAQGTYDRNYAKARSGYEDARSAASAAASAGSANANQAYNRALSEYTMGRDEFWTAQDRQQGLVDRNNQQSNFYAGLAAGYGNNYGDILMNQGDVAASGRMGSSNAWGQTLGGLANTGMDAAMYYGTQSRTPRATSYAPDYGYSDG